MRACLFLVVVLAVAVVACGGDDDDGSTPDPVGTGPAIFTSGAFSSGGAIPIEFTCDGDNIAPPLNWRRVPIGTQSLALLMDDQDADGYVHWVMYNIPADSMGLGAGTFRDSDLDDGSFQGVNSRGEIGYTGPCPGGEHRYLFRLYALDAEVDLEAGATLAEVEAAIADHVLALSELVGTYSR